MNKLPSTNKRLGQHWLTDSGILSRIAACAEITAADTVLEIGPGVGTLTQVLSESAKKVIAVEFDTDLAHALPGQVSSPKLEVVNQDILKFDLTKLPKDYKIVANIPYYLTSNLIRNITNSSNLPSVCVLLVQKEVAERLAAKPGNMSVLSIAAQSFFIVSLDVVVSSRYFTPPPKVDSQVVVMKKRDTSLINRDDKKFFRVVKAGFSNKRKTLLNSLSGGLQISKDEINAQIVKAGLSPNIRAQELSISDWIALARNISLPSP